MKILCYAPLAVLGHHFETDLEIIQKHLNAGDEVTVISCSGQLRQINFMACQGFLRCSFCTSRCKEGLNLLKNTQKLRVINLDELKKINLGNIDVSSIEKLKSISYKGVDIGGSYASSLISDLRDPLADISQETKKTKNILESLAGLTDQLEKIVNKVNPELVYMFNGRVTLYRPLLQICEQKKIPFYVHERGSSNATYSITLNNMPHDIATKDKEIRDLWAASKSSEDEKTKIGSSWYESRALGNMPHWYSFTDHQDVSLLPPGWDDKNHNVTVYVSSDDEFAAVPGWEIEIYETQMEGLRHILSTFASRPEYRFFIRMHPNLRGLKNRDVDALRALDKEFTNCFVITPESEISTYSLLKKSDKIISFGSTTGIEAAYWQKPSILIGKGFYMNLKAVHRPLSREDAVRLIENKNLEPLPRDGAVIYGFWAATAGEKFEYYKSLSLTAGEFNGHVITGNKLLMLINYFFVLLLDLRKIFRGEYGLVHLKQKIRAKTKVLLPASRKA